MESIIGPIVAIETPPQGGNSRVTVLVGAAGRIVRKEGEPTALAAEARALAFLEPYAPFVPRLLGREGEAYLYSEIPGVNLAVTVAAADSIRRRALSREFGRALRRIHGWKPALPPPAGDWLDEAVEACQRGAVSYAGDVIDDPASPWHGVAADMVAAQVRAARAALITRPVLGHGDWCLPNAMACDDRVVGAVDWGDAGWADYRFDLATGLWTLRFNLGDDPALPGYLDAFLSGYGYRGDVASLAIFEAIYILR